MAYQPIPIGSTLKKSAKTKDIHKNKFQMKKWLDRLTPNSKMIRSVLL